MILSIDANTSISSLTVATAPLSSVATDQVVLSITAAGPAPIKGRILIDVVIS